MVYLEIAFSAWCLWWLWVCLSGQREEGQEDEKGSSADRLDFCGDEKQCKVGSPSEILNVHQHGVLLYVQLISQQQQLHQLLVKTCIPSHRNGQLIIPSLQMFQLLLKVSSVSRVCLVYTLWIWECRSLVITCSCPRLMSLMSPRLRFLFIKPSLMWGRCGSCVCKTHTASYRQKQGGIGYSSTM